MSRVDEDSIGARVASLRKQRGLSQQRLAAEAHLSKSLVSKVETGQKPATQPFVAAAARVLGAHITDLTGQPYRGPTAREDAAHATIPALRRELAAYQVPPEEGGVEVGVEALAAEVAEASRLRHGTELTRLGQVLPDLLARLRAASHAYSGKDLARVYGLWAETYDSARQLAYKLGYIDLASLIADRYAWAAAQTRDPLMACVGDTMRAHEFISVGDYSSAYRVLAHSRARLDDGEGLARASVPTLSVYGYLHLESGLASARAGDGDRTRDHLAEAGEVATRIGEDRDDYRLYFGPTNVGIWSVALAVEQGNGTEAVKRAQSVRIRPGTPRERAGHHYIDLARGQLWHGDRHGSLDSLLTAEKVSPEQARNHPMVRETTRTLIRLERQAKDSLRGLANRIGLPD